MSISIDPPGVHKSTSAPVFFDPHEIRREFPILQTRMNGHPLAYLDNAATTQKPGVVLQALDHYYRTYNANIHRGAYRLSEEATLAYEKAHRQVADFINAPAAENIIFTRNCTEAINLVAYSWARVNLKAGDRILLSQIEHHSNLIPWQLAARESGAELDFIPIDDRGRLELETAESLLTEKTKLVAVSHASNVLGTINPVKDLTRMAHEVGAIVLIDGAQSAPHFPVDVQDLDCDFFAFSGHKMLAPTGIGALYGKSQLLDAMPPFLAGGDMISDVTFHSAEWNQLPWKFEAGTPAIAQGIAFGVAAEYLAKIGMNQIAAYEHHLLQFALEQLDSVPGIRLFGDAEDRTGVISFTLEEVHPHDIATFLDHYGVAIRAGHHCAQPLMKLLGVPATARASFYLYNTEEDILQFVQALQKTEEFFHQ